jgi:hypothetical protein
MMIFFTCVLTIFLQISSFNLVEMFLSRKYTGFMSGRPDHKSYLESFTFNFPQI